MNEINHSNINKCVKRISKPLESVSFQSAPSGLMNRSVHVALNSMCDLSANVSAYSMLCSFVCLLKSA